MSTNLGASQYDLWSKRISRENLHAKARVAWNVAFRQIVMAHANDDNLTGYTPQHIARLEAAGRFPKRIQLGQNRVAWVLSEVDSWIAERINNRDTSVKH